MPTAIFADSYVFVAVQLILTTSKNKIICFSCLARNWYDLTKA